LFSLPRTRFSLKLKLPLFVAGLLLVVIGALCTAAYLAVRKTVERTAVERLTAVDSQLVAILEMQAKALKGRVATLAAKPEVVAYFQTRAPAQESAAHAAVTPPAAPDTMVIAVEFLASRGERFSAVGSHVAQVEELFGRSLLPDRHDSDDSTAIGQLLALGDTIIYPVVTLVSADSTRLGYLVVWRRNSSNARSTTALSNLIGAGSRFAMGTPGGIWVSQAGRVPGPSISAGDTAPADRLLRYEVRDSGAALAVLAVTRKIPGSPWHVVVEFPAAVIDAPAHRFLRSIIAIGVVLLLLSLIVAWRMSRHLVTPLLQLTAATEEVGHGEHAALVPMTGGDELGRLAAAFNRMVARVEAEAAARIHSESQWRLLFEQNPQPMWVCDHDTLRFLAVNESAVEQYGLDREHFLERSLHDLRAGGQAADTQEDGHQLTGNRIGSTERHLARGGAIVEVEITHHSLFFAGRPAELVLAHNITARQALEAQARQAQKMEAVGRLAGGVAHDFNNLLAVIAPYAEMLRDEMPAGSRQAADLEEILNAAERGRALTGQLLSFSRQQVLKPAVIAPDAAVRGVEILLRRLLGEDVELITRLEAPEARIRIDPGQFEQVLVNLAVNARDAMPSGGHLVIATGDRYLDDESLPLHGLARVGRYLMLSVTDTGVGMDAVTAGRIFEPFFTTKPVGKGTGIGLATVYGIVTQSGGRVTVYSEPGVGTTFRLYFAVVEEEATEEPVEATPANVAWGEETILLVEDDAAVRAATVGVMERHGYSVLVALDPEDALQIATRDPRPIHLVVSDVVMPKMGGPALLKLLREHRPDLKALLISGYAGEVLSARGELEDDVPFLEKPFTVRALLTKLRQILDVAQAA
jgi:PAS domain S-box-containing protein